MALACCGLALACAGAGLALADGVLFAGFVAVAVRFVVARFVDGAGDASAEASDVGGASGEAATGERLALRRWGRVWGRLPRTPA